MGWGGFSAMVSCIVCCSVHVMQIVGWCEGVHVCRVWCSVVSCSSRIWCIAVFHFLVCVMTVLVEGAWSE